MRGRALVTAMFLAMLAACAQQAQDESAPAPSPAGPPPTLPSGCVPAEGEPEVIRFGATPYVGTRTIEKHFGPILDYLAAEVGVPVQLVTVRSYDELQERFEAGEVDVASLSPLVYVRAKEQLPCIQLLLTQVTQGSPYYSGYIVVRADSPVDSFAALRGKSIAFTSRNSASGDLFPRAFVRGQGHSPEEFFSKIDYRGDHLTALEALLEEEVDAAATFAAFMRPAREAGLDVSNLRVLAVTGRIPFDAICAGPHLPPGMAARVRDALFSLNTTGAKGRSILGDVIDMNGWVMTDDSVYDSVRKTLQAVEGEGQ